MDEEWMKGQMKGQVLQSHIPLFGPSQGPTNRRLVDRPICMARSLRPPCPVRRVPDGAEVRPTIVTPKERRVICLRMS